MTILAIDTSNYPLGIALLNQEAVIGEYITNIKGNHSVRAMPAIQSLMKDCGIEPKQLTKIVVAKGPGSYTGVRIGVTIAKTLAWSLNIPIVGVSSLEILAATAGRYFPGYISPLFDARRGQIYTGLYTYQNGNLEVTLEDQNILIMDWVARLSTYQKPILFLGNDLPIHRPAIEERLGGQAIFAEITELNPRPSELGLLGMARPAEEVHQLVPNYIRLAEAEVKWMEATQKEEAKGSITNE
jgi:tRNA threonylcarbamoyladenosine biosynthesis protein TsaB